MITDMNARVAMAQKLSIPQLQQAIKNGTVPAYVGVPLLQDKMRQQQQMAMAQQGQQAQQQRPIADEVMDQAYEMNGGVDQLPSNLPIQNEEDEENYAGGGIVAFADEGRVREPKVKLDPNNAPTVRELMEVIGGDREKFEQLAGGKAFNPKDYTPKEIQAAQLLFSANQTKDPERYLESLNPFHDSQLDYKLRDTNFSGFVSKKEPNTAVIRRLAESESIVPHELTHTLQSRDAARGNTISRDIVPYIEKLSPKTKEKIFGTAVNRFDTPREIYANLNDYAMRRNAAGEDFVNSPEGRELLPNRRMQGQYYSNTMPGIQSIYGYREDTGEKFKRDSRDSYATQLAKYAKHKTKNYANGGGIIAFAEPTAQNNNSRVTDPDVDVLERMRIEDPKGYARMMREIPQVPPGLLERSLDASGRLIPPFSETPEGQVSMNDPMVDIGMGRATDVRMPSTGVETIAPSSATTSPTRGSLTAGISPADVARTEAQLPRTGTPSPKAPPSTGKVANIPLTTGEMRSDVAAGKGSMLDQYAAMLMDERKGIAKDRQAAKAMAIFQAGLGIAGGTSPNPLANISQGALQGTQAYQQEMKGIRREDADRLKQLMVLGVSKEKLALEARKLGIEDRKVEGLLARYAAAGAGAGNAAELRRDQLAFRFFDSLRKDQLMSGKSNEEIWGEAQRMAGKTLSEGASTSTGTTTVDWGNLGSPKK